MSADFASVVLTGPDATLNWCVLLCRKHACDNELGRIGGLFEGQKRESGKDFFSGYGPPPLPPRVYIAYNIVRRHLGLCSANSYTFVKITRM